MNGQILFIGLDVDDKAYHAHAFCVDNSREFNFKCKPNVSALSKKLSEFKELGYELKICYEATYLGFSLSRDLLKRGFACEVIAPSLVPRKPGEQVKTDRIDAKKLAGYYMKGELTVVHIPGKEEESIRDLVRSRGFLRDQIEENEASYFIDLSSNGTSVSDGKSNELLDAETLSVARSPSQTMRSIESLYV